MYYILLNCAVGGSLPSWVHLYLAVNLIGFGAKCIQSAYFSDLTALLATALHLSPQGCLNHITLHHQQVGSNRWIDKQHTIFRVPTDHSVSEAGHLFQWFSVVMICRAPKLVPGTDPVRWTSEEGAQRAEGQFKILHSCKQGQALTYLSGQAIYGFSQLLLHGVSKLPTAKLWQQEIPPCSGVYECFSVFMSQCLI